MIVRIRTAFLTLTGALAMAACGGGPSTFPTDAGGSLALGSARRASLHHQPGTAPRAADDDITGFAALVDFLEAVVIAASSKAISDLGLTEQSANNS